MTSLRYLSAVGLFAGLLFITACSRDNKISESGATLEGTITFKGEKVMFATVFVKGGGKLANGRVDENGKYTVENCPTGEVQIGVNTQAAQGEYKSKMMAGGAYKGPEAKGRGKVTDVKFIDVPQKYFEPDSSGLKTTVNSGKNTFDIVIDK